MPLDPNMKTNHPRFDIPKYLSNALSSPLAEVERLLVPRRFNLLHN